MTPPSKPANLQSIADLAGSFDSAPWAVTELSSATHVVRYANPAFCELIDRSHNEVIGRPFESVLQNPECLELLDRVYRTGAPASFTAEEQGPPWPVFFAYTLWPVVADGHIAGVMIQVNETGLVHGTRQAISQALLLGAIRQDELIEAAATANLQLKDEVGEHQRLEDEAKLLTKEVSHRVKNNLQIVVALLSNEIRRTPAPWVQGYLAMQERIGAIAQLYDLISQSIRGDTVDLGAYLAEIATNLSASLLDGADGIRIAVEAEPLEIESKRAVPFGLLVNELVTNSIKHAFPGGSGLVTADLRRRGDSIELTVSDDGVGFRESKDSSSGSHGSDYVAVFVRQLGGALERPHTARGTRVSVIFPLQALGFGELPPARAAS